MLCVDVPLLYTARMRRGKLIENNIPLKPKERLAVDYLLNHGFDIELYVPTNTPKNKNPDFYINGKIWELKSPITSNKNTIKRLIKETNRQSNHIVVDIRQAKLDHEIAINILSYEFKQSRRVKELMVLTNGQILRFRK